MLIALAGALFAFIYLVERHIPSTSARLQPPGRLLDFKPAEVTSVHLRRTNQFVLKVERSNDTWNITSPFSYPAQPYGIQNLLKLLADLQSQTKITVKELGEQNQSIAKFGLDVPSATVTLGIGGRRLEILFGSKTSLGDRVYMQLMNSQDIYVVGAEVYDKLPPSPTAWRDIFLVNVNPNADRMEFRAPGKSYAIQVDPTNHAFMLSKPAYARADRAKVDALKRRVQMELINGFETDDPQADLEQYGLQPPEAELIFGQGANDQLVVQFGKSVTNDPTLVYARRMANTNIVKVSKSLLEELLKSPSDLRDYHLVTFTPEQVNAIEVEGSEKFVVQRQGTNGWMVSGPQPMAADPDLVREWLNRLATLEGNVEKDVVTDFSMYGLAPAVRQYSLRSTSTNVAGVLTNRLLASIALSTVQGEKVFARGSEDSVYSLKLSDVDSLPSAPWQLRDRRVWSFTTNQVASVTIHQQGYARKILRKLSGEWTFEKGSTGILNSFQVEETIYQLGNLKASAWVAKNDANRVLYGFKEPGYKLVIELKGTDKPQFLTIEFGDKAPSNFPYALANVDGQNMVFEFPLQVFIKVAFALGNPAPRTAASGH